MKTPVVAGAETSRSGPLSRLEEQVRRDLELLGYPRRPWVPARTAASGERAYDVVVVGAGQGGLATAFGLMRERVTNLLVVDQNPLDRPGPWLRFARMHTLRTPKYLTGPDLGIPSLTPAAWYEAAHGAGSFCALGSISKESWANYLGWYRRTLDIPVLADTRVGVLEWNATDRLWQVPCTGAGPDRMLRARRVVLATGIEGSGRWHVPDFIREALPESLYAHTHSDIDFGALRGKRIAILGAGASAFDNASTALEAGARGVTLFCRRSELVKVNPYRWAEFAGFLAHFGELPDEDKWRFIRQIVRMGQLPPADTYRRATRHEAFRFHPGEGWTSVGSHGDGVRISTDRESFDFDFVIVATGFITDLAVRPELSAIERHIARWADRFTPAEGDRHDDLLRHPYLGPNFEFMERIPGSAPYVRHLYNFTFGGLLSLGFGGASISGMKYSVPRLVGGLARSLFLEDRNAHFESLRRFEEVEF